MTRVLLGFIVAFAFSAAATADDVVARYNKSCAVCHAAGVANAPKTGDAAAWGTKMEKGLDALVASVEKGLNAMPPKGMCFDCTADDYKALIEYRAKPQ